ASAVTSLATATDDTPLVPKNNKSLEPNEELRAIMFAQDAYYTSRRVAGDTPSSLEQAGQFRDNPANPANALGGNHAITPPPFGPWTQAGPNPIVQIGRTSGGALAVSGRVGALAIQPGTGRIVLGAAQGGIWTYDATAGVWTPRTD